MHRQRRSAAVILTVGGLLAGGGGMAVAGPKDSTTLQDKAAAAGQARMKHRHVPTGAQARALRASSGIRAAVTPEAVERHMAALQDIAKRNGGNRAVGNPGYTASGAYVEAVLKQAGYHPRRQHFDFTYEHVNKATLTELAPTAKAVEFSPLSYSPATPAGGVTAAVATPSGALGCTARDYTGASVKNKIVVVRRGTCPFGQKAKAAKSAGAVAVVVYNNTAGPLNGTLGEPSDDYAPAAGITQQAGQDLVKRLAAGPLRMKLVLDKVTEKRRTFNIVAETPWGNSNNVVMAGAHLDSVQEGPGINDNGSGSATILEVAAQLAKQKHLRNKVRFAWWGAEELGLVGSEHYVKDLKAKHPADLKKIATYLNFDMVGSPNYMIGVYDADQSTYESPVKIPAGSAQTEAVMTTYFDNRHQAWVDTEFDGRSDYDAFISNGIPASGLFTGAEVKKSKGDQLLFGGQEGKPYDPNYHQKGDRLSNVSMRAIDINSDAIAHTIVTLAKSTKAVNGRP